MQKAENQQRLIEQLTEENETLYQQFNHLMIRNNKLLKRIDDQQKLIDDLHLRLEEMQAINSNQLRLNDRLRTDLPVPHPLSIPAAPDNLDLEALFTHWKSFPGQTGQNTPNLRKQVILMAALYRHGTMSASQLFNVCGIGGVTGARYVSVLKKAGLICYIGARKKGHYELTPAGLRFIERSGRETIVPAAERSSAPLKKTVESSEDL
jgi:predicted transcriptional regulator